MELTFLGTSTMAPTKDRNNTAIYLQTEKYGILFDCAEGTQRQFKIGKINFNKLDFILISHHHGDHTLGICGLIQTLATNNYKKKLTIFGPKDTKKYIKNAMNSCIFTSKIDLDIIEISNGKIFENENIVIESLEMTHSVPCVAYSLIQKGHRRFDLEKMKKLNVKEGPLWNELQKGKSITVNNKTIKPSDVTFLSSDKKVTYCIDTSLNKNTYKISKDADILICESTFDEDLKDKAQDYGHMSVDEACDIANKSKVKQLILTHFSARYKTTDGILKHAKEYFKNVICAYDFFKVKL